MAKMIEGFVDASQGSLNVTRVAAAVRTFGNRDSNKRTKKAHSCFHEHGGEADSKLGEAIAVAFADPRYEAFGTKFSQVITKLSELIIVFADSMAFADALEQIACRPVVE